ncbi:hypothetical protein DESUT3_27190 [Desulfuromonas versatilis]|uniref:Uncharacterized protein n=1 Tax=Desulfuromonas versatilis TaxID=2802975 RepID=A0ABN6E020_9BACT|nr:hypothetical protein DESUT3_27190 [Desulfuromonas versatilis]
MNPRSLSLIAEISSGRMLRDLTGAGVRGGKPLRPNAVFWPESHGRRGNPGGVTPKYNLSGLAVPAGCRGLAT